MPMRVAVRLFPIDQLSRGVCMVMPSPYFSPTIRPFQVTTKAAVMPSGEAKAASTAAATFDASSSAGSGSSARTSPIGQGVVAASGSFEVSFTGV